MKRSFISILIIMLSAMVFCANGIENNDSTQLKTRFAWGADAGATIDLTGNDMSAINFAAFFGITRGWINFLGIGAGADIVASNSCRSYPVFVDFRTNFDNRPTLLFWDLRLGASLNYLEHNHNQVGIYGSTGLGINLARGRSFCSYMIAGYTFRDQRKVIGTEMTHDFRDLHYASFKIGINF